NRHELPLTPGSSPGQALSLSPQAGRGNAVVPLGKTAKHFFSGNRYGSPSLRLRGEGRGEGQRAVAAVVRLNAISSGGDRWFWRDAEISPEPNSKQTRTERRRHAAAQPLSRMRPTGLDTLSV